MEKKLDFQENDNRRYNYFEHSSYTRAEFPIICDLVQEGSSVLDLGCGDGSLIELLQNKKKVRAEGLEISESGVAEANRRGIKAKLGRIDEESTYHGYQDKQFDYAICNVTIQMVMFPEVLIREMRRVSKFQIIPFPNFAFIRNRLDLLLGGRMPRPMLFGYSWYSTGHIHQLSVRDFENFCAQEQWPILNRRYLGWRLPSVVFHLLPANWLAKIAIYLCSKN